MLKVKSTFPITTMMTFIKDEGCIVRYTTDTKQQFSYLNDGQDQTTPVMVQSEHFIIGNTVLWVQCTRSCIACHEFSANIQPK